MNFADVNSFVGQFFEVIIPILRVAFGLLRDDAEGHLWIIERRTPRADHLREHLVVHRVPVRFQGVVVPLMPNGALNMKARERRNHARAAIARVVHIHGGPANTSDGETVFAGSSLPCAFNLQRHRWKANEDVAECTLCWRSSRALA